MLTILVINSKGGSGKTTLTTNLAGYYAARQRRTAIIDYDPQGSSLHWLQARPKNLPVIHAASGAPAKGNVRLGSRQGFVPPETEVLLIDAPAGIGGLLLKELVRKANYILIPVAPSPIDIRASADFIKDLFLVGGARTATARMAVVASRVRNRGSTAYAALERFLISLKMPFLASLSDSEIYLQASEQGVGIFELDENDSAKERQEFMPIVRWLEGYFPNRHGVRAEDKQASLESSRKWAAFRPGTGTGRYPALRPDEG
ncbi:MAG: ParA family protein [Sideroxydans sp.]